MPSASPEPFTIRPGTSEDLPGIASVQGACPEVAHWNPADYLDQILLVSCSAGALAGFIVGRETAPGEGELLNLAVDPRFRRQGVARALIRALRERLTGTIFLEVRESNEKALIFYQAIGFKEVGMRPKYYINPCESAIVMKFHS